MPNSIYYLSNGSRDVVGRLKVHVVTAVHKSLLAVRGKLRELRLAFLPFLFHLSAGNILAIVVPTLRARQHDKWDRA